ncbi:MAG: hypothetical protein D6828_06240, partial [Nitrospirae bacterium]
MTLDSDGHYRGPNIEPYSSKPLKKRIPHDKFGLTKPICQDCHNNTELGYDYVSTIKFIKSKHFNYMIKTGKVDSIQDACLSCHVDKNGKFIPYPGDHLSIPKPFNIYKVKNDNTNTCGKCHINITGKNRDHMMATAKGHYYRSEFFPYQEALSITPAQVYKNCNTCHTSCASSCHMIGKDKQAIKWTFIQPFLDHKVGKEKKPFNLLISDELVVEAMPIREYLIGHYMKGGGPGYRMLAKKGRAPIKTIELDIESHEFVVPNALPTKVANDICLRCHTCMVDPNERLNTNLAHSSIKCVDCHRDGDVHGHDENLSRFSFEAVDASCTTCHLKEDIKRGKAATEREERITPIVNPVFYNAAPEIPPLKGAHKKLSCEVCHSAGMKQCDVCHVGDLEYTVGDVYELGKKLSFLGRDNNDIVRLLLIHRIVGRDGKKYGGWIMKKTIHSLKRDTDVDCEGCHGDKTKMGINIPKLPMINTYLIKEVGVKDAYIEKEKHY